MTTIAVKFIAPARQPCPKSKPCASTSAAADVWRPGTGFLEKISPVFGAMLNAPEFLETQRGSLSLEGTDAVRVYLRYLEQRGAESSAPPVMPQDCAEILDAALRYDIAPAKVAALKTLAQTIVEQRSPAERRDNLYMWIEHLRALEAGGSVEVQRLLLSVALEQLGLSAADPRRINLEAAMATPSQPVAPAAVHKLFAADNKDTLSGIQQRVLGVSLLALNLPFNTDIVASLLGDLASMPQARDVCADMFMKIIARPEGAACAKRWVELSLCAGLTDSLSPEQTARLLAALLGQPDGLAAAAKVQDLKTLRTVALQLPKARQAEIIDDSIGILQTPPDVTTWSWQTLYFQAFAFLWALQARMSLNQRQQTVALLARDDVFLSFNVFMTNMSTALARDTFSQLANDVSSAELSETVDFLKDGADPGSPILMSSDVIDPLCHQWVARVEQSPNHTRFALLGVLSDSLRGDVLVTAWNCFVRFITQGQHNQQLSSRKVIIEHDVSQKFLRQLTDNQVEELLGAACNQLLGESSETKQHAARTLVLLAPRLRDAAALNRALDALQQLFSSHPDIDSSHLIDALLPYMESGRREAHQGSGTYLLYQFLYSDTPELCLKNLEDWSNDTSVRGGWPILNRTFNRSMYWQNTNVADAMKRLALLAGSRVHNFLPQYILPRVCLKQKCTADNVSWADMKQYLDHPQGEIRGTAASFIGALASTMPAQDLDEAESSLTASNAPRVTKTSASNQIRLRRERDVIAKYQASLDMGPAWPYLEP